MSTLRISLRAGERIFVNGAVLKFDRKTNLEFMNDVTFLLESHVIQPDDANTPLRQLYFTVQVMLIDPAAAPSARRLFEDQVLALLRAVSNRDICTMLQDVAELVERDRVYEALKRIRAHFPIEKEILSAGGGDEKSLKGTERHRVPHPRTHELALEKAS